MNTPFLLVTILFVVISVAMVLIILVQRPSGGGLAGAFGGAGGGGSETVFGGRVGDALTWATVICFVIYLGVAISLNKLESTAPQAAQDVPTMESLPEPPRQEPPMEVPGTGDQQPSLPPVAPTPEQEGTSPGLSEPDEGGAPAGDAGGDPEASGDDVDPAIAPE